MPEVSETSETEAQTRTRSALGGFERDAKTFEGHLNRITASAEAFVKRCAKFAISDPDHPRLAETAELLAEAKRILGKSEPTMYVATHDLSGDIAEPKRGPETWQLADSIRGLVERVQLVERRTESIIGHMGGDLAMIDGEIGMDPSAAERIAALPDGSIEIAPSDPLAKLAPDAAARVQAAIDQAAAKRAAELAAEAAASIPVSAESPLPNPFAVTAAGALFADPAKIVNPFAGLTP